MPSLLVTNDFPPKIGGIQSYLYELWRRLPPEATTVLTTPHAGAREWDRAQGFRHLQREVNVRDWDVGLHIVFESRAAHDTYQTAPDHLKFIAENKPTWKQVRVFDTDGERIIPK